MACGGGEETGGLPPRSLCADSSILTGYQPTDANYLQVNTQADVDALEGCEEIPYDLWIGVVRPANTVTALDLRPLHALRIVRGQMSVQNVASLAGLEQLERVTEGLSLYQLSAPSLRPLSSLTLAGSPEDAPGSGGIEIGYCDQLEDLSGLEALEDFDVVTIAGNTRLRSVWPLRPGATIDSVSLQWNFALVDIGSFDTLENVRHIGVENNEVLADLSALRGLRTAETVRIVSNASLAAVSLPNLALVGEQPTVDIASNPKLERLDLPLLQSADRVAVRQNLKLNHLDLSGLLAADYLVIGLNLALTDSGMDLNPDVRATTLMRIGGNGFPFETEDLGPNFPDVLVLNPCPFADDGYCDECYSTGDPPCQARLCGLQSDGADCL